MLNPAGAVIQAILATYQTIAFFVERLRQIAQVAAAFIDSIAAIASGAIDAAANRVEKTLAGLLTLAISFLASFARLGNVSEAVIKIIQRIRAPIDRALDRIVAWVVATARRLGKLAAAGAAKLFSWAFAKRSFKDEDGHAHDLFVQELRGAAILAVASTPLPAEQFVNWYLEKKRDDKFAADNRDTVQQLRQSIERAKKHVARIDSARSAPESARLADVQRDLLAENVVLTGLLSTLVGSDRTLRREREKYLLEGLTGTYGSIPKPPGDDFTADHQPQAAILQAAAEFDYFGATGELAQRAHRRARQGFAINLHKLRHEAGRTYGAKGKKTKEAFLKAVKAATARGQTAKERRRIVVAQIKSDLDEDVAAIREVAKAKLTGDAWAEIRRMREPEEKKEKMRKEIADRIAAGANQLASQPIDSLVE
jgi:hypothetical protein